MWIFVLLSLTLAHGTLAEVDCSKNPYDECENPDLFSFVPTDVSVFNKLCPELTANLRCLKEFQDQCGEKVWYHFNSKEEYEGMYGFYQEVCEEGTFLNRVATENLRCFNETFRTTSCPEKVKAITGPYRSPMEGIADPKRYWLPIELFCLQDLVECYCAAADIRKNCGQEALEAILEFFRRTFYFRPICGEETAESLLKNLDEYNLDQEQKVLAIAALEEAIISTKI